MSPTLTTQNTPVLFWSRAVFQQEALFKGYKIRVGRRKRGGGSKGGDFKEVF